MSEQPKPQIPPSGVHPYELSPGFYLFNQRDNRRVFDVVNYEWAEGEVQRTCRVFSKDDTARIIGRPPFLDLTIRPDGCGMVFGWMHLESGMIGVDA